MNEKEIKNLLAVYQQKVSELLAQTIALEARVMNLNQIIDTLNKKIAEIEKQESSKRTSKKTEDFT